MRRTMVMALIAAGLMAAPAFGAGNAAAGKEKAYACTACHGMDGKREILGSPGMPRIAGMDEQRVVNSLRAYRAGQRFHPLMQVILWTMTDKDIEDMAAYYAGLGEKTSLYDRLGGKAAINAFDKFNVPARERQELFAMIGPMKGDIVAH